MKKKLLIFFAVLVVIISTISLMIITATAEEKKITVSYLNNYNPFHPDPGFDKTAYENGKQIVTAGEEFTLPTTSNSGYLEEEGYQLRWYTHDGRSYKGGETVSFTEDTRLYRVTAKEVYSFSELNTAMTSNSHAAILMTDIYSDGGFVSVWGRNHAILDLGGHTLTISKNGTVMGGQRSASVVLGEGTFKVTNPDGKVGSYAIFDCKGHGYDGDEGEVLIGRDVKIDAPNFYLCTDYEGSHVPGFPYIKICGTLDVQYILNRSNGENSTRIDFYESCDVTLRGKYLNIDYKTPTDTVVYNKRSFDITIYGGLFKLPAEAANEIYWSTDNLATENELTAANKDQISILGGTFILPDGKKPAIDKYLTKSYMMMLADYHEGMPLSNIIKGTSDATAYVHYTVTGGYRFDFKKNGSLIVTDNAGTGLGATYYYTLNTTSDGANIESISLFTDADKTIATDVFEIKQGASSTTLYVSVDALKAGKQSNTTTLLTYGATAIVPSGCDHSYEPISSTEATCIVYATQSYKCSACNHEYTVPYGEYTECTWELVKDDEPTATTPGVKTYCCKICGKYKEEIYYLDVSNENIDVVVTGNKIVSVKVSDVFNLTSLGDNMYTLTGVKAFGEYASTDIIEINIPMGISVVNIADNNESVVKMNIMDGATVSMISFAKLSALTEINIGKSNVTFVKSCANNAIQKINSNVAGASVTFGSEAFNGKMSITELNLCSGSAYDFQKASFHASGLKELILPDNSKISWGNTAFAECQQLEYVYIGSNIGEKQIVNDLAVFDGVSNLKKVVIMDLTYLGQWAFSTKAPGAKFGPLCDLTMYIHSESLTMNANCLNNRNGQYNVYIYTVQNSLVGINNCNYTIYKGIPHALTEGYEAPTCTEDGANGYITDCPCGLQISGAVDVQKYFKSISDYETIVYESVVIPATGHKEGEIVNILYENGYMNVGVKTCICATCEIEYVEETPSAEPMFMWLGYSMPENGELKITVGFSVNTSAVSAYEKANGVTLEYGITAAIADQLNGKSPLDETLEDVSIVKAAISKEYSSFDFVVSGFTAELCDLELVMAAYVAEGNSLVYLQDTQTDLPESISISKHLAGKAPILPPEEEETPAA